MQPAPAPQSAPPSIATAPLAQATRTDAGVAAPAPAATGFTLSSPVSLIGAVVAVVGSLLPWFDAFGTTTSSFDVAAAYLLDSTTTASDSASIGLLVVILGGATAVACLVPRFAQRAVALRALGIALLAAAGLFGYQVVQMVDDVGVSFGDVFGIGPVVTAVGGLAVLSGR